MKRIAIGILALFVTAAAAEAAETFITITQVAGQKILISESGGGRGGRGRGGRGARGGRGGRGRGRGTQPMGKVVVVPPSAKITSASRERRTGEFRVGVELSGGLRNKFFHDLGNGVQARIVTNGQRITEINVFTEQTDINQSLINPEDGSKILAIRPKRPPQKR